jgi:hypothetical protein
MEKIKVKIYKDPNNKGNYINKTAKFLQKAKYGMQKGPTEDDVIQTILDELTLDPDADSIAYKLQSNYGMSYLDAMDKIDDVVSMLYKKDEKEMIPEAEVVEEDQIEETMKPKLYSIDQPWISEESEEDAEGWGDELAMKKGGSISKKKFIKNVVGGLKKAAAGMEQEQSSESSILDTPINGRQSHINNFRRGIKDLGNEHYAKEIYESTKKLQNQVQNLPPAPMGQEGYQTQEQDVSNIKQPMNQVHGAGYEIPQARRGKEQRQADRQQRQINKDWKGMFGDMAAGYSGVPGMPNYLQVVSPQVNVQGAPQGNQGSTGPFIDIDYKKGPWWKGNREWSAKGIPAEMLMGMSGGRGSGVNPGYGYMPGGYNYGASWSTSRTYPGEIIRTKSRTINNAADPAKNNNVTLNNNANKTKSYPGYMELNPAPSGTEMVYDEQGNEVMAISPDEAARRKAAGNAAQYPWMTTGSNINFIPEAASNTSSVELDNNPEDNSTAQNLEENEYERSFMDLTLDPENKMHHDKYSFMNVQDPEELKQGNFDNYYFTDPATGQTYMSNNYGSESSPSKQSWNPVSLPAEQMKRLGYPIQHWDVNPNDPEGVYKGTYNPDKTQWYSPDQWMQYRYNENKEMGRPFDEDKYYQTNYPDEYGKLVRAYGGPVSNPQMDPNGNLQRFVYGGNDMDVSPMVAYDNNDIQTKNVDDPYMFREGGLYEYDGEENSQVNYTVTNPPAGTAPNQYQTPAYKRYNSNATAQSNFAAYNEMKQRGLVTGNYSPTQSYDMSNANTSTQNQGTSGIQAKSPAPGWTWEEWNALPESARTKIGQTLQTQNQGNNYPQGYPTAPTPFQQVKDMFSIFKKNPETGKNYDFTWMSQNGPARTSDGNIWQPPGQTQGQTTTQGQTNQGAGTNQTNPKQAGYMYDYKYEKGPWWSGKKTVTLAGKWVDPNNPNAGASASGTGTTATRQFNDGKGPTLDATASKGPGASNFTQSADGKSAMSYDVKDPGAASSTTPNQPSAFPPGDPRGEYMKSQLTLPTPPVQPDGMPAGFPANTAGPRATEEDQMMYGGYMAYGGYVPEFQFAGQFNTSSGPFNPSGTTQVGGIGQGLTGPCTEAEVQDPNSPCYDPNYKPGGTGTPQDFEVSYDVKKARTLNTKGIANIMGAVGSGIQGLSAINQNIYNDDYLNSRTTADNREPSNELDYRGGYSGLNQRIMSKGQGAGSTGFNSVVGNAAFVKKGGQLNYQRGEVYDLTQEEIGRILAAGGQLEFIS